MIVQIVPLRKMPRRMDFLDYLIGQDVKLEVGQVVEIPFRNRDILGLVVGFSEESVVPIKKLKEISVRPKCLLALPARQISFARRIAEHYHYPLSGILKMMVPDIPKNKFSGSIDGLTIIVEPSAAENVPENIKKIVEQIFCSAEKKYLIFEYDGQLKDQFFVEAARKTVENGEQCLLLFPNLAKIEQFMRFLPRKLANNAVVVTSQALTGKNRYKAIWQGIFESKYKIVIGTRSALFFTFDKLGAVLVDSSHSVDYKNYDQNPRFHGITVAKWLAEESGAFLALASPAPRVVDYHEAKERGWKQITLGALDWQPRILDFSDVYRGKLSRYFGHEMINSIQQALDNKERALVIVNRKGTANALVCADCGFSADCDVCKLPMNVVAGQLKCLRCGKRCDLPLNCPKCRGVNLKQRGIGIDQVEKEARRLFPAAKINVVQASYVRTANDSWHDLNAAFRREVDLADIVIATADILNYADWPCFTLLGIVYADGAIYSADYLSNSRLYEFLHELIVRAKMSGVLPQIIIQTRFVENQAIQSFGLPYSKFFDQEIAFRKQFKYPPFVELIKLICQGEDEAVVKAEIDKVYKKLQIEIENSKSEVFPPYPYYAKQVRKRFRWQILLKINADAKFERQLIDSLSENWLIDKDPVSLL